MVLPFYILSPNPLFSLCIVFGPHLPKYLICNCFLVSYGCLRLSWVLFTAPAKNHITVSFSIFSFFLKIFFCLFLLVWVTLQSLLRNPGDSRHILVGFTEMLLRFAR